MAQGSKFFRHLLRNTLFCGYCRVFVSSCYLLFSAHRMQRRRLRIFKSCFAGRRQRVNHGLDAMLVNLVMLRVASVSAAVIGASTRNSQRIFKGKVLHLFSPANAPISTGAGFNGSSKPYSAWGSNSTAQTVVCPRRIPPRIPPPAPAKRCNSFNSYLV